MILDALNDLRLQYFVLSLIAAIAFYFIRRKILLWISLAILAMNAIAILPWYVPSFNHPQNPDGQPFRLLAINVLNKNREYHRVIDWIAHEQADLVVLSEVIAKWNPWAEALSVLKQDYSYHVRQDDMEIEVYSRWPLSVRHKQSYGEEQDFPIVRGFLALDVDVDGQPVIAIATHAFPQVFFGRQGFNLRNQHLQDLGDYLSTVNQPYKSPEAKIPTASPIETGKDAPIEVPIMVAGDLNVTMWSPHYRILMGQSKLKDARQGFGILPSQSSLNPQIPLFAIPIDHSFVSRNIEVVDIYTGPNLGSDHLPITTDVVLPIFKKD
ncbi:MAG: endonuclease/exonuclease/phosphatase family protein [Cyanobacteria bacterium P01_F01_bin.150]